MKPLIAIVDDDRAIRTALSSLLRAEGFRVGVYSSAEELLDNMGDAIPDCLLTDIQMSGMNGLDLQAHLSEKHPALPVFIMTAFPEEHIRNRALSGGAHCFLKKPFEARDLLICIRSALNEDEI